MTKERILSILKSWHDAMTECDTRMDDLAALTGEVVESPLGDAVYHLMGEYTKAVADQIGWCEDTLSAWWTEHQFGGRPMKIGFSGESLRTIDSIEALAEFIVDDLARAEQ